MQLSTRGCRQVNQEVYHRMIATTASAELNHAALFVIFCNHSRHSGVILIDPGISRDTELPKSWEMPPKMIASTYSMYASPMGVADSLAYSAVRAQCMLG